jgi:hypothetical protein
LQLDSDLSLDKAIRKVRQSESIKQQQLILRGENEKREDTLAGAVGRRPVLRTKPRNPSFNSKACYHCGRSPLHDRLHCPAKDTTCRKCGKWGHYETVCQSSAKVGGVHEEDAQLPAFLGGVYNHPIPLAEEGRKVSVAVNKTPIQFQINTGAEDRDVNRSSQSDWEPPLSPAKRNLKGPSNSALPVQGHFVGKISLNGQELDQDARMSKW